VLIFTLLLSIPAPAQPVPPDEAWMTFDTPNFRLTYPQRLEQTALRAADRAERVHELLRRELLPAPAGRIEIVVSESMDLANGVASIFPRNRLVLYVHPPVSDEQLAFQVDWLEMLILHELVHIFHLDHGGGVWSPLRRVLGRNPLLFPQALAPGWIVEGLATYFESEYTGAGRARGTAFDMILRAAVLEEEFFPIDRVTFDPVRWPGGTTAYAYGSIFVDHLARRYGHESVTAFVERLGRQLVPYGFERAARRSFGTTLTNAFGEWEREQRAVQGAALARIEAERATDPEILVALGRQAAHPRFEPDGSIVFAAATGRADAELMRVENRPGAEAAHLAPLTTIGPTSRLPAGGILVSQIEFTDPYRLYSDLFSVDPSGEVRRMTRGARVWEADVRPDGKVVAVASAPGTNLLVLLDGPGDEPRPLVEASLDVYWSAPRWSPDGSLVAASRWQAGGFHDVVILDTAGVVVREVTGDRAVDAFPSWSPDGRYLLFGSDRTGVPNLFAYELESGSLRQVTNVRTGAFHPSVSPDGRWIAFSYYGAEGYRIARIPFDPSGWRDAPPPPADLARPLPTPGEPEIRPAPSRYSAWPSILPTRWSPVVEIGTDFGFGAGLLLAGRDVIERHDWRVEAFAYPADRLVEGEASYLFRGLGNPVLQLGARQIWAVQSSSRVPSGGPPALFRRDREAEISALLVRRRWRSASWAEGGVDVREVGYRWADEAFVGPSGSLPTIRSAGTFVGAGHSTVRSFGVSLGPQVGVQSSGRLEARRLLEPGESVGRRDYWRFTGRNRAYRGLDWFGFAPSVVAIRLDGGVETTSTVGFSLGGGGVEAGEDEEAGLLRGGSRYPVRGYPAGFQGGNRIVSGSLEYRFPIALVERGIGVLPIGLDRFWGAAFTDAGAAWCPGECPIESPRIPSTPRALVSVGAEVMAEVRVGYFADVLVRIGFGVPLREATHTPRFHARIGRLF
jgi:hypothetical protein